MIDLVQAFLHPEKTITFTDEFNSILKLFEETSDHYFLTGNAGTGKSTLVDYFRTNTKKNVAILAPTGLSAVNVRGQTIHTFFRFPPRLLTPEVIQKIKSSSRLYRELDTIIIDEASMVRADMLDGIDQFLRKHGKNQSLPFGGIQMILVGDLLQLPPVVTSFDQEYLGQMYESPFIFSAQCFAAAHFSKLELKEIFRQSDSTFVQVLNKIRTGNVSEDVLDILNERVGKLDATKQHQVITLAATNKVAQRINQQELDKLPDREYVYEAKTEGDYPEQDSYWPVEKNLKLKVGARVLFVKNGEDWVNGTLGKIESLAENTISVRIDGKKEVVEVPTDTWEHVRYEYDLGSQKIEANVLGRLRQYPLRLAWAITVHKSQGMTFERVHIDYSSSPFAHGQTYVALSRCKSLEGITLSQKLYPNDIIVDEKVTEYLRTRY
jgi:ATP-dependent DNA helicase PIF1